MEVFSELFWTDNDNYNLNEVLWHCESCRKDYPMISTTLRKSELSLQQCHYRCKECRRYTIVLRHKQKPFHIVSVHQFPSLDRLAPFLYNNNLKIPENSYGKIPEVKHYKEFMKSIQTVTCDYCTSFIFHKYTFHNLDMTNISHYYSFCNGCKSHLFMSKLKNNEYFNITWTQNHFMLRFVLSLCNVTL